MNDLSQGIDLDFRPAGYFWPMDLATHLLATVKGAERRKHIQSLIDEGRMSELGGLVVGASMEPEALEFFGKLHPWFLGGEYLPDMPDNEVEIARVTLASTTQDVVSVRARKGKRRIYYRVVDEYGGDTLSGRNARTSVRPLTLGKLIGFLDGAWSVREVVTMNDMECDVDEMRDFVTVSSPFYPNLARHYGRCFAEWAAECQGGSRAPREVTGEECSSLGHPSCST